MTVVCAGHVNWDVTLQVDHLPVPDGEAVISGQCEAGGGSAANTAAVLAGLDREPVLLGSVGDDEYAGRARRELAGAGVDCTHLRTVAGGTTTVKYLVVEDSGEVMVLANDGVNEAFEAADLPHEVLAAADHLHLTSQRPATAIELAEAATAVEVPVSVDPGRRLDRREFGPVLERADVVFLNAREATAAREDGLLRGRGTDRLTVVTHGENGATVNWGEQTATRPAFEVEPVDTAGAGDAFAAGFLAARLDGADNEEALAVANACGALTVRSVGARTTISRDDVRAYRNDQR